jgi:hypothetical protein
MSLAPTTPENTACAGGPVVAIQSFFLPFQAMQQQI